VRDSLGKVEIAKIPSGWINHSFYTSQSQMRVTSTAQFVPRIKLASKKVKLCYVEIPATWCNVF